MRPGNAKGWGKGKSKGINGMEYSEGAFPPIGGVTHESDQCDNQEEYGDWWSQQEEWQWPVTKPIGAMTRGKGNGVSCVSQKNNNVSYNNNSSHCECPENEEFTQVKGRKGKKRRYEKCHKMDESIHQAKTYNRYGPLDSGTSEAPRKIVTPKINGEANIVFKDKKGNCQTEEEKRQMAKLRNERAKSEGEKKIIQNEDVREEMKRTMVATLTRMKESAAINACGKLTEEVKQGWTQMSLAVDSGACESVINPDDAPGHEVMESMESRRGDNFASATGEPIPNLGTMNLPMMLREMSLRSMKLCAAPVTRPLASVKKICRAGHMVIFDDEGSYIYNKATGEVNMLREDDGNYMLDVWVPPSNMKPNDVMKSVHRQP